METSKIDTGYIPRECLAPLHTMKRRFNIWVLHRRAGKSVAGWNDIQDEGLRNILVNPQYAYVAPTYGQAKRVIWSYAKEFSKNIPGVNVREGNELKIEIHRPKGMRKIDTNLNITEDADLITFYLLGADNPDSHRGLYFDGVMLDEYQDMNPIMWTQVARPALMDRHVLANKAREKYGAHILRVQGWSTFSGTPKGMNHFHDVYKAAEGADSWFRYLLPASKSGIIPASELEEARRTMTEDEYRQEMECDFNAALTGAYYSELILRLESEGKIDDVPFDPNLPVATFWDLGVSDSMAIWFIQKRGERYRVIDYIEGTGKGVDHYAKLMFQKPYVYSKHHFPHDAAHRDLLTGQERVAAFQQLGLRPSVVVPKCRQKIDAINAVRRILPMCSFDKIHCEGGIAALRNYQREWDAEKKIFTDKPRHDWTSHGADAFTSFAMGVTNSSFDRNGDGYDTIGKDAIINYDEFSL